MRGLTLIISSLRPQALALALVLLTWLAAVGAAQTSAPATAPTPAAAPDSPPPTRAEVLRGEYGRYRANNDLLFYHLDIRVDPEKKFLSGRNTIRFRMLQNDTRIQLDLYANLAVDKILLGTTPLTFTRELNTVWVDFPETLRSGRTYSIDFHYSGTPKEQGRFGGISFEKDPAGRPWVFTACEDDGAAIWWPNKDQWRDEVERMDISVSIPNDLVDVSNGRLIGKTDLGDGFTRWDWSVRYPINNYNVALNIGRYVHFADRLGDLSLDYYVLPENIEKAKKQFAQAGPMLQAFEKSFGEYPFRKDGYKLIEVPYAGMEHQSAVAYGNRFLNGYLERDWTGVGISLTFDFIIIHESGHEWFGNAVSAADVSDMWIHEGWTTYLEGVYVEHLLGGTAAAIRYLNGLKPRVKNAQPIITQRGIHRQPDQDMYFKAALFLNTLRSVVDDDPKWWATARGFYQRFKYQNIMTEDVVAYFNAQLGRNLTPVFDQYLRRAALPTLELAFQPDGSLAYRWKADEHAFAMPVRIGTRDSWTAIEPTTSWKVMQTSLRKDSIEVATDRYYVNVAKY
jgi:aminopeptidase N